MNQGTTAPDHILQVGFGFWASKTLLSAIELEVFTELAKHPLPLNDLQGRLGLHPRSARDFFDALVALGFLERSGGTYRNTPATDMFLAKHKPTYIGGILEMCNHRLYRTGAISLKPCAPDIHKTKFGKGPCPCLQPCMPDPARLKEFLRAMTGSASLPIAPSRGNFRGRSTRHLPTSAPPKGILPFRSHCTITPAGNRVRPG